MAAEKFKNTEFQGSAEQTLSIKDCDKVTEGEKNTTFGEHVRQNL